MTTRLSLMLVFLQSLVVFGSFSLVGCSDMEPIRGRYVMVRPLLNESQVRFNEGIQTELQIERGKVRKIEIDMYGCKKTQEMNEIRAEGTVLVIRDIEFSLYENYSKELKKCIHDPKSAHLFSSPGMNVRLGIIVSSNNLYLHFMGLEGLDLPDTEKYLRTSCPWYWIDCWF